MARTAGASVGGVGLAALRRSGAVTEMLFLYECQTQTVSKLREVADRLGLTVQAVSHLYRELARRGWVEVSNRQYVLTVSGTAALQGNLSALEEEIRQRLDRLQIVRTTVALAGRAVSADAPVALELVDGVLTAVPGRRGASRGRTRGAARPGEPVEVGELEGIVPITPGATTVLVVPRAMVAEDRVRQRAGDEIRRRAPGLIVAQGLEALYVARRVTGAAVGRFGAAAACLEASRLGVNSVAFVTEEELPRFLASFAGPRPPAITVTRLR